MPAHRTLTDALSPAQNSLGALRLVLALAVIISHAFVLATGSRTSEPFLASTGFTLADMALAAFFVISGLLTAQSLERRGSAIDFLWARTVRIVPLVVVYALLFALAIAPFISSLGPSAYLIHSGTWEYIVRVVAFAPGNPTLPGVFGATPLPHIVNEPLWTLKCQIASYLALAFVGTAFGRRGLMVAATTVVAISLLTLPFAPRDTAAYPLGLLALCFALGVGASLIADRLPLSGLVVAGLAAAYALTRGGPLGDVTLVLLIGYGALWFGTLDLGPIARFARETDLSYGIYVLGWPAGQLIADTVPGLPVAGLALLNLAIVVPLAMLSAALVEEPALRLKGRSGDRTDTREDETDDTRPVAPDTLAASSAGDVDVDAQLWTGRGRRAPVARVYTRPFVPRGM